MRSEFGISPTNLAANIVATFDAFIGLFSFALATGLLFARFSRPTAKILYSKQAVMAAYQDITAFMFRIANQRRSQLIELELKLIFTRVVRNGENVRREYHQLRLERSNVTFFPLHWTILHPINEESPLFNMSEEELRESQAEILILLTGIDDTFSQTVHSRSSYFHDEIIWNARFKDPFSHNADGSIQVDLKKMHEIRRAEP